MLLVNGSNILQLSEEIQVDLQLKEEEIYMREMENTLSS